MLVTLQTSEGKACFHYVMAEKEAVAQLRRDYEATRAIDVVEYGEVLYSGWGEPTPEEEAMVKARWGKIKASST